jgi:tetratricopeptide (TPR) repeat protein
MVLATGVVGLCLHLGELAADEEKGRPWSWWLRSAGIYALASLGIGGLFALVHAARLIAVTNAQNLIHGYYLAGLVVWSGLAALLFLAQPRPTKTARGAIAFAYLLPAILALLLIVNTNISIVSADVLYKQGLKYDNQSQWDNAIYYYGEAIKLAPSEDFYYLFLGRALMERGKQETNVPRRDVYFQDAFAALQRAKALAPLNTDHTANMGRLYRTWAELDTNATTRAERLQTALGYYAEAVQLSPHNAQLYNEWGLVLYELGDLDQALIKYDESLVLDQQFSQTYLLKGDVYLARKEWAQAIQVYQHVLAIDPKAVQAWSALAYAHSQSGDLTLAITDNVKVLEYAPNDYVTLKNLAILYREVGLPSEAVAAAQRALAVAPESDRQTLQDFIAEQQVLIGQGEQGP